MSPFCRSCQRFGPSLAIISEALDARVKYKVPLPDADADIWSLVLRHAFSHPIEAYSLAAQHSMDALCVKISPCTLSISLDAVSEADALNMGALYLRRLFNLHLGRRDALKRVIEAPPAGHCTTAHRGTVEQDRVTTAWELAVADIVLMPMLHNMQEWQLKGGFSAVVGARSCTLCAESVRARVAEVLKSWSAIKMTI